MEQTKYDVFISYSRKDYVDANKNLISGNEVSKIKDALKAAGITYWFDEEGVYSGNEFAEIIVRSIKASRVFVFLSTQNANQSEWTASEISTANMLKKKIIPVRIDDSVYHDSVILYISRLSHIDYHDNPEKGRKELIRSIKSYLNEEKRAEEQKIEEEKLRLRSLELQRQVQEEEKCRQAKIAKIETDIAALETQLSKCKRTILDKEHELRLAQEDYDVCDAKIKKLKDKIDELKNKGTELISKIAKDNNGLQIGLQSRNVGQLGKTYKKLDKSDLVETIIKCCEKPFGSIFGADKLNDIGFDETKFRTIMLNKFNMQFSKSAFYSCITFEDIKKVVANQACIKL